MWWVKIAKIEGRIRNLEIQRRVQVMEKRSEVEILILKAAKSALIRGQNICGEKKMRHLT